MIRIESLLDISVGAKSSLSGLSFFFISFSYGGKHASMYVRVCGIFVGTVFLRHPPVLLTSRPDTIRQGPRSSGPIIQTSRRGEDRRDGVSKATCSPSAPLLHPSSLSRSKQSTAKRKRVESKEKHGRKRERERDMLFIHTLQPVIPQIRWIDLNRVHHKSCASIESCQQLLGPRF